MAGITVVAVHTAGAVSWWGRWWRISLGRAGACNAKLTHLLTPGSLDQVFEHCKVWYMTEYLIKGKFGNHRLM